MYGLSNIAIEEEIEITAIQGRFMVILGEVWRHT